MINCPCGFGRDLQDDQQKCPICGMDLTPLLHLKGIPGSLYELGMAEYRRGRWDEALKNLSAAVTLDKNFVAAYVALGDVYCKKELYEEALTQYDKALELEPCNTGASEGKIKAGETVRKLQEAEACKENELLEQKKLLDKKETNVRSLKKWLVGATIAALVIGAFTFQLLKPVTSPASETVTVSAEEDIDKPLAEETTVSYTELADKLKTGYSENEALKDMDIEVTATDSSISVAGKVPDDVYKSLVIEMAKGCAGNNTVDFKGLEVVALVVETEPEPVHYLTYTVKPEDTLAKIAYNFYGDYKKWSRIFDANKESMPDCNTIQTSQVLKIPIE